MTNMISSSFHKLDLLFLQGRRLFLHLSIWRDSRYFGRSQILQGQRGSLPRCVTVNGGGDGDVDETDDEDHEDNDY